MGHVTDRLLLFRSKYVSRFPIFNFPSPRSSALQRRHTLIFSNRKVDILRFRAGVGVGRSWGLGLKIRKRWKIRGRQQFCCVATEVVIVIVPCAYELKIKNYRQDYGEGVGVGQGLMVNGVTRRLAKTRGAGTVLVGFTKRDTPEIIRPFCVVLCNTHMRNHRLSGRSSAVCACDMASPLQPTCDIQDACLIPQNRRTHKNKAIKKLRRDKILSKY